MKDDWRVEVRQTPLSPVLATVPYTSLMFTEELNDVGGGSVTFDLDVEIMGVDNVWVELLERPNTWLIKRNDQVVSAFVADSINTQYATAGGSREVVVSGKGILEQLSRAVVLPPNALHGSPYAGWENGGLYYAYGLDEYQINGGTTLVAEDCTLPPGEAVVLTVEDADTFPESGPFTVEVEGDDSLFVAMRGMPLGTYTISVTNETDTEVFSPAGSTVRGRRVHAFHHFYKVLRSAQERFLLDTTAYPSALIDIVPGFTRYADANGQEWQALTADTGNQENGPNLLELLSSTSAIEGDADDVDYRIRWEGTTPVLEVAHTLGTDLSKVVVFYNQSVYDKARSQERGDIKNFAVARSGDGSVVVATSSSSRAQWGRRETLLVPDGASPKEPLVYNEIRSYSKALSSWSVSVPPEVEVNAGGIVTSVNRVFDDYTVGDWIGVGSEGRDQATSVLPLRVAAVSGQVDNNGNFSVELTLDSVIALLREVAGKTRK